MTLSNSTPHFTEMTDSQKMLVISLAVNELQNDVRAHNKLLITGDDGVLPIPERIRNLEGYINNLKFWGRFIGIALAGQTIAFAIGTFVALVRFYPLLEKLASP